MVSYKFMVLRQKFNVVGHKFNVVSHKFMVLRHKFNVVGHKFNVVGHESLVQCSTNENEGNLQKNECSSSRSGENTEQAEGRGSLCSRSGENTEQTEIRGKPSHDSWLELSILTLSLTSNRWGCSVSHKMSRVVLWQ